MGQRVGVAAKVIFVLILVYCFLISIGLMGAAFKGFGKGFAESLISSTSNPFVGLFIGVLATGFLEKLAWYMEGLFDGVGGIKFTSPIKMITKPARIVGDPETNRCSEND